MNKIHELKTAPCFYYPVAHGLKKAEVWKSDRGFKEGDFLLLKEFSNDDLTGRQCIVRVTHVLHDYEFSGVEHGYVVLSIELLSHSN